MESSPSTFGMENLLVAARLLEEVQTRNQDMAEMDLRSLLSSAIKVQSQQHSSVQSPASSSSSEEMSPSTTVSSTPCAHSPRRKPGPTKHSRVAHNILEKTRRANLRTCLERLKELVPPGTDASRNTTLALLTRGRDHLKELDESLAQAELRKEVALAKRKALLESIDILTGKETANESTTVPVSPVYSAPSTCATSERSTPFMVEYSPSSKPLMSNSSSSLDLVSYFKSSPPTPTERIPYKFDPIQDGLLPPSPICYPRPSVLPYTFQDLIRPHSFLPFSVDFTTIGSH